MRQYERARQVGLAAIALALVLRLYTMGLPRKMAAFLTQFHTAVSEQTQETGQDVRFSASLDAFSPDFAESPPVAARKAELPPLPAFSGEEPVKITYSAGKDPDIPELLRKNLQWSLYGEEPTVLILHTHSTESYTKKEEGYKETSSWRTLDEQYNMLSIGQHVARILNDAGIPTVQDREYYDYPSYNGSYTRARKAIQTMLEQYPSIRLVLDLHRDASDESGRQLRTLASLANGDSAQLMLVLGTNHKGYEENLSLGLKLHALLERNAPGITRPLQLRAQRFNQDLCPGALLVEVGAAGNSHPEAMAAAEALAEAVIGLAGGTA